MRAKGGTIGRDFQMLANTGWLFELRAGDAKEVGTGRLHGA